MAESHNLISVLLTKWTLKQEMSDQEMLALQQWCEKSEQNRLVFEQFQDPIWLRENLRSIVPMPAAQVWQDIERRINASKAGKAPVIRRLSYWAAAIIIVGFSIVGIRSFFNRKHSVVIASTDEADHAFLKDGNGNTILLDSITEGKQVRLNDGWQIKKINANELRCDRSTKSSLSQDDLYQLTVGANRKPFTLRLTDGSRVRLEPGASYRFNPSRSIIRDTYLEGNAWFDIAADPKRPVKINVDGDLAVDVLGTCFAIKSSSDQGGPAVSVSRGKVKVSNPILSVVVDSGSTAVMEKGHLVTRPINNNDAFVAWSGSSVFHFNDEEMNTVIGEIADWYGLKVINPGHVKGIPVRGMYTKDQEPESLLKHLEDVECGQAFFHLESGNIIVTNTRKK